MAGAVAPVAAVWIVADVVDERTEEPGLGVVVAAAAARDAM